MTTGDKSHSPTPQRRERARREGHIPRGSDLTALAVILGGLLLVAYGGPWLQQSWGRFLQHVVARPWTPTWNVDEAGEAGRRLILQAIATCLPGLAVLWIVALVSQGLQTGWNWWPQRVAPDIRRIHPGSGLTRLANWERAVDGLFVTLRLTVGITVALWGLWANRDRLIGSGVHPSVGTAGIAVKAIEVLFYTVLALAVIAFVEYGFRLWRHEMALRMTAQEAREESRGLEGDVRVRALQKEIHQALGRQKPTSETGDAAPHAAAALRE